MLYSRKHHLGMVSSQTILSLLRPPSSATIPSPPALAEEAERNVQRIQEHFSEENFQLPNAEGSEGKSALSDREMMFLVSFSFISLPGCGMGISADQQV